MSTSLPKALNTATFPNPILLIGASVDHAVELSKRLLGEQHAAKIDSGNHPDFHLIEPEGKSHLHPVANIHKLIKEMGLPPFEAKSKIFVIVRAEKMLPAAANALLKTLEEPNTDTFFILLSDQPDKLLPTVISRLSPIQFPQKSVDSFDMAPYVTLAERGEWDVLLDSLEALEGEDVDALFQSLLHSCAEKGDPSRFFALSKRISEAKRALDHHVKLKTVVLNLLLLYHTPA